MNLRLWRNRTWPHSASGRSRPKFQMCRMGCGCAPRGGHSAPARAPSTAGICACSREYRHQAYSFLAGQYIDRPVRPTPPTWAMLRDLGVEISKGRFVVARRTSMASRGNALALGVPARGPRWVGGSVDIACRPLVNELHSVMRDCKYI